VWLLRCARRGTSLRAVVRVAMSWAAGMAPAIKSEAGAAEFAAWAAAAPAASFDRRAAQAGDRWRAARAAELAAAPAAEAGGGEEEAAAASLAAFASAARPGLGSAAASRVGLVCGRCAACLSGARTCMRRVGADLAAEGRLGGALTFAGALAVGLRLRALVARPKAQPEAVEAAVASFDPVTCLHTLEGGQALNLTLASVTLLDAAAAVAALVRSNAAAAAPEPPWLSEQQLRLDRPARAAPRAGGCARLRHRGEEAEDEAGSAKRPPVASLRGSLRGDTAVAKAEAEEAAGAARAAKEAARAAARAAAPATRASARRR